MTLSPLILAAALSATAAKTGQMSPTSDVSSNRVKASGSTTYRSNAARWADTVNVKDYGATGNGVTDDTAAIQAAIDAVPANGGQVYIPDGTYIVSASIVTTKPSLVIRGGSGSGWNTGAGTRIVTNGVGPVFTFGSASSTELRGVTLQDLSINDNVGTSAGAVLVLRQWNCVFRNVAVNGFAAGYAFKLDATGGSIVLTQFENVRGRVNRYGITVAGTLGNVTGTNINPSTYFAGNAREAWSIGVEMMDGQMVGAIDSYATAVKLVGDSARVSGRLEGNTLGIHVAGTLNAGNMTARRNVISGARIIRGGVSEAVPLTGIQIDNSTGIFDTVIVGNTYSSLTTNIADNSVAPQSTHIWEPQAGTSSASYMSVRRNINGAVAVTVENSRTTAGTETAEYRATTQSGTTVGVLRAHAASKVQIGSSTARDVELIRGDVVVGKLTSSGVTDASGNVYATQAALDAFQPEYAATDGTTWNAGVGVGGVWSAVGGPAENRLRYSEQMDQSQWTKGAGGSISADSAADPGGVATTADRFTTTSTSGATVAQTVTTVSGTTYTGSMHLKYVDNAWYRVLLYDGSSNQIRLWINAQTCAKGTTGAAGTGTYVTSTATSMSGGWCRISLSGTVAWTSTVFQLQPVTGDGSTTGVSGVSVDVAWSQLTTGRLVSTYQTSL